MFKNRLKKKTNALTCLTLVTLMSFSVAVTAAAFAMVEKHSQNITIDMGYAKYFGNGTDENGQPVASGIEIGKDGNHAIRKYFINNYHHLKNLSTLVNIGAFDKYNVFEVTGNIECDGKSPMLPIGNDQFPFVSKFIGKDMDALPFDGKFEGNIAPIISNLHIVGNDLADVGMFGYIGNEAEVQNFILVNPFVESLTQKPLTPELMDLQYNWQRVDDNPLRDVKDKSNNLIFSPKNCESIVITNDDTNLDTKIMTKFKISLGTIATNYMLNGISMDADIKYEISRPDLVSYDQNTGFFNGAIIDQAPVDANGKIKQGDYLTISVVATGIGKVGDSFRMCKMTLERFKLYYKYDGKGFVSDPSDMKNFASTIYPKIYNTSIDDNTDGGDAASGTIYYDDIRGFYVGVVAGRLDGLAHRIGVQNPILNITKPFISKSLLIGLAIDDDNKRTLSNESFTTTKAFEKNPNLSFNFIPRYYEDFNRISTGEVINAIQADRGIKPNKKEPPRGLGNRYVSNIYEPQDKVFTDGLMTKSGSNVIRIYGTSYPKLDNNGYIISDETNPNGGSNGVIASKDSINVDGKTQSVNAISMTAPMDVYMLTKALSNNADLNTFPDDWGYNNAIMDDCLQFWVSAKRNNSKLNFWNNNSLEFYLNIEISYLYFDDKFNSATNDNDILHKMYFLAGEKNLHKKKFVKSPGRKKYQTKMFYSRPRSISNNYSDTTTDVTPMEILPTATYKPTNKSQIAFVDNDNSYIYANDKYYPFAYLNDYKEGNTTISAEDMLLMRKKDTSGMVPSNGNSGTGTVRKKIFSITANKDYTPETASIPIDRISNGFFPIFYLGFADRDPRQNFRFDILDIKVTLSNKRGNMDSSYGTVDFARSNITPAKLPMTYRSWISSGVRLSTKTIENELTFASGSTSPTPTDHFARVSPEARLNNGAGAHCQYKIMVNRENDLIKVYYNPVGIDFSDIKPLTYIMPTNTEGFKEASITHQDFNLPTYK